MITRSASIVRRERFCACGTKLFGPGKLCNKCQPAARTERNARRIPRERLGYAAPQPDPDRNPQHLAWIITHRCAVPGCRAAPEYIVPAHVRLNTGGGTSLKPPDRWTTPLCHAHHMEQHKIGHLSFDAKYRIDSRSLAETYAARSPHL